MQEFTSQPTFTSHTEQTVRNFYPSFFFYIPMDISRVKKMFAGMSAAAVALTQVGTAFAAYSDVPAGVWYEDAVDAFVEAGYLDSNQTRFRGGDLANRAEFIKLVVELNGGILSTPPAVPSFDDVAPSAWFYGYIEEAAKEGWVRGDNNCYGSHPCWARPGANINRAEAAALIVRAFGLEATGDAPAFVDVPNGQWYTDSVQTAADHCVVQGDAGTRRARPADNMNRAEMVAMLHRVDMGLTYGVDCTADEEPTDADPMIDDVTATSATTVEVEFNVALDQDAGEDLDNYMVMGDDEIEITGVEWIDEMTVELTLAESLNDDVDYTLSVEDIMTDDGEVFSDSMTFNFSPIEQGEGTLEVSVASTNPAADSVPRGAVGVVLLSLDLTASCEDSVTIQEITVLHEGFGEEQDIDGVYASQDGGRISRRRTLDSENQTADLRLSEPLVVGACDTETIDIVADFNSTAQVSGEHNIAVELPSDFQSNALEVEGNFPMRGNTFRVAAVTSGKVTIDYRTVSPDETEVGKTAAVLGKFEIRTDSVEDQTIYAMTLEQQGSAGDGDVTNIMIRRTDGTVLTNTVTQSVGDFVTLVFDPPFTILEGDKITLEVVADVNGGAGDTVSFGFEEESDIFAVGSLYGYGVNGQLYGSQVLLDADSPDSISIDAGELTIEIDGPVQQKYTNDDDDAVLGKVLIRTGGDAIDIKDLFIAIQGQTSSGAGLSTGGGTSYDAINEVLEDVELRNTVTGETVSAVRLTGSSDFGTGTASNSTYQIYRFDDFEVEGDETWELRVDFIDNGAGNRPLSGDRFRAHICTEPKTDNGSANTAGCDFGGLGSFTATTTTYNMVVEGLSTGDDVEDVRPGGTVSGNFHRIANPELNIAVQSIGSADTAVKNSKDINLLRFEARAGEAEDVLLTSAIFNSQSGSLLNGQNYTLWVDSDGDNTVDMVLEDGVSANSNSISFNELTGGGFVIPAEETITFEVHADIAASLTNDDLRIRFATGATGYIEAEQVDDGSSLSGISTNGASCGQSTCEIKVSVQASKLWTLVNQGDLFVTKDTTPVRARQLLAGTLGDAILRLQFRAQNEDIDVTDLQLTASGSNASSVDRLELYRDGETTAFATATIGGCGSDDVLTANYVGGTAKTFCANMENGQLIIREGQNLDVVVRPRLKTDEQGATSKQLIQLMLAQERVSDNSTGSGSVRARGRESSNNLIANNGSGGSSTTSGEVFIGTDTAANTNSLILGNMNHVVLSKITSITNANPDADNTNVPTGPSRPFGQFKFTAATNNNTLNGLNKATLSGIIFNVNATNVTMDPADFKFYNKADSSTKVACTPRYSGGTAIAGTASGAFLVECRALPASSVDTELDSGESTTFVLEGEILNSKVSSTSTSTLQASLVDFTNVATDSYAVNSNHIHWLDKDTSSTNFYWIEYPDTVVNSTSYKS